MEKKQPNAYLISISVLCIPLYTNIPHDKLLERLNDLVDFAFKGGNHNIRFNSNGSAYWGRKVKKKCFTARSLKTALYHLISNWIFTVGNIVIRQKNWYHNGYPLCVFSVKPLFIYI